MEEMASKIVGLGYVLIIMLGGIGFFLGIIAVHTYDIVLSICRIAAVADAYGQYASLWRVKEE